MRAIEYTETGGPEVLKLVDTQIPEPAPGQVRVKVSLSGVNPTDWKARAATPVPEGIQVPHQDGAGIIDAVGQGVDAGRVGERVWIWEAAFQRRWGTAAEFTVVPAAQAVPLGDASFELGAALGIPFLTAHRCLTLGENVPERLGPGTLQDRVVLVQGGAGAVGNAAIQLARWADATVIATVSSPAKAELAAAAGADHVIDYRNEDVVAGLRKIAPRGADVVVEVALAQNAATDADLLASHGTVASYGADPDETFALPVRAQMTLNSQWHFVLVYTMPARPKELAVADVSAAVAAGAVRVGEQAGLPLHVLPLASTAEAQLAVQNSTVGKVLVDVTA
ncbi:zinc-binding dehydrogenase [Nakamurella sp. YIM 132087]|uniref:Zinc-binding dehydrogenase n=1 Tax=Nakamurella alba TaxID=2665158 RepID=A0A7K1FPN8_9ACTN|nr:NADPH:quinone reductase [Nakamurella alba]MTD15203.1 zinc-binding dehydrogenase [Nakamurella alba]